VIGQKQIRFLGPIAGRRRHTYKRKFLLVAVIDLLILSVSGCNYPSSSVPAAATLNALSTVAAVENNPFPILTEYLTGSRIVFYDPFNNMSNWNFRADTGMLTNDVFQLQGAPLWHASFWPRQEFTEGQGLVIRFKVQHSNARSEFVFVTGNWMTDSFRQFGVYNAVVPKGDLFQGVSDLGGYDLNGDLRILSNTWYYVLLAIGHKGHFLAVVWNPDDDTQRTIYDVLSPPNWTGLTWVFLPKATTGETVYVTDFSRIRFTDIK
jgi:hypothetical protein